LKKKKVVILTAMDPYKDIRAIKTAKSLVNNGMDVTIVAGYSENKNEINVFHVETYDKPYNIKESVLWKVIWKIRFFITTFKTLLKNNADVLHACNIDMLVLAYFISLFKKKKLVYDSYEICAHKSGVSSDSKIMSNLIERIEKFLINKISYMICVSNSAKDYFLNTYKVENIEVITNVPFRTDIEKEKPQREIKNILYLGNFSTHRGIEELILSAQYLNSNGNIRLQGFGAFKEDFNKIIKHNKLESKVKFIEPIDPSEVLFEISKHADIGVVLTKPTSLNHELTISNKIFDYINAGIPVIMSNVAEHRYLNEKYDIGIIIPEITPELIAKTIDQLIKDEELYKKLAENCFEAAKVLNWDNEQEKLKCIYNKMFR
jgi:glycosyltransferase involved in cell wall biosynthesis